MGLLIEERDGLPVLVVRLEVVDGDAVKLLRMLAALDGKQPTDLARELLSAYDLPVFERVLLEELDEAKLSVSRCVSLLIDALLPWNLGWACESLDDVEEQLLAFESWPDDRTQPAEPDAYRAGVRRLMDALRRFDAAGAKAAASYLDDELEWLE